MAATAAARVARVNLVTGGAGFIGRHLVRALLAQGEYVRVLDREQPAPEAMPDAFIAGSITDRAAVERAMEGVDRVFHLAALAQLWVPHKADFLRVNHEGTLNVLQAARAEGVASFVHCSTEAVLTGHTRADGITVDEDARPTLRSMPGPYCRAKLLAERAALEAAAEGHRVIVVNPTVPIGPGDRYLTPPARMLLGFLNGEYPAYLETTLNLVDVRDVAAGHIDAAEFGVPGRRYVLGGTNIRLSQLLGELETLTGLPVPRRRIPYPVALAAAWTGEWLADRVTRRPPTAPLTGVRLARARVQFDNRRAREELGVRFRPLAESLRDTVADFRRRGLLRRTPRPAAGGGA